MKIKELLNLTRMEVVLPAPILIMLGAYLLSLSWLDTLLLIIIGLLLLIGTNILGEVKDYYLDSLNNSNSNFLFEEKHRKLAILFSFSFYFSAFLIAIIYFKNYILLFTLLLFSFLSLSYIFSPFEFKKRGILGIISLSVIFLLFYLLPYSLSSLQSLYSHFFLLVVLLLNTGLTMLLKDFKDIKGDRKLNINTPVVLYGQTIVSNVLKLFIFLPLLYFLVFRTYLLIFGILLLPLIYIKFKIFSLLAPPISEGKKLIDYARIDRFLLPLMILVFLWFSRQGGALMWKNPHYFGILLRVSFNSEKER